MIKVKMFPHVSELAGESGINRVVEAYFKHLPEFGIELVSPDDDTYDLIAAHAGITGPDCHVAHTHGLYWSGDFNSAEWEWRVNARVIAAIRNARQITVPSAWVAETFKRDMRLSPHVIPHGIDWQDWQHHEECQGYVIWNKNRRIDACDNSILDVLLKRFPDVPFVSTLPTLETEKVIKSPMWPKNFRLLPTGTKTPHSQMMGYVQRAGVYLSTTKETFGIGVLEAMASGVPVLGYAWGGNVDLVQHGVSGYLARPNDIDDLCEGLNFCLKHRRVLGQNGRELAKQWTWARACEMVAGVYRLALEEPKPTVSVVIPVYNKSNEQLGRAIESCFNQTFKPEQITVVNDGSNNSEEIRRCIASFKNTDILYIEQPNQGVANARNNGISHSSGKYICCLDADDWLEPTFLEVCIKELEQDRSFGIAYTGLRAHNSDGSNTVSQWPGPFDPDKQLTYAKKQNQVPTACVFRRDAWERVGGYKSRYCPYGAGSEDAAFWSAICSIGYSAKLVTVDYSQKIQQITSEIDTFKRAISSNSPGLDLEALKVGLNAKINELEGVQEKHNKPLVLFNYSASGGQVHGNREYAEVDWLSMYPWAKDGLHPFASVATPKRHSHPVRQYDEPLVSVIIPVGPGHEKEVTNALDSLEMQHFRKWEAVVVWDCQKSVEWYDALKRAYPYIRDIANCGGAGVARNRGVEVARAPLILFLDADDVLASPDALTKMVKAWNDEQAIIYSEYLGKAIWDYEEAKKTMGDRLLDYNHKHHTAVFEPKKVQGNYDCELAQRQPEYGTGGPNMSYYHWALVSVLIPKSWHNAIGGFDESMATWEDVDYHWRLARAGYCYYRVEEPLVLYNYHKGYRREAAQVVDEVTRQKHQSLIQYIKRKYEDLKPVGCNCGGKRNNGAAVTNSQATAMGDENFVMIEFDFPGSEARSTYGKSLISPTKQLDPGGKVLDYRGYARQKGDRFLVHTADQKVRPDMFKLVQHEVVLPETAKVELPEPQLLVKTYTSPTADMDGYTFVTIPDGYKLHVLAKDGVFTYCGKTGQLDIKPKPINPSVICRSCWNNKTRLQEAGIAVEKKRGRAARVAA